MSTPEVKLTIKRVKEAKEAYFATGSAVIPDDEYDALEAIVRREGGDEGLAVVAAVGFQKKETGVPLPHVLPSLSKIKPGEKSLARFLARGGPFVVSEKLDGVSALFVSGPGGEKKLYNRGNGVLGTSITEYAGDIQGLPSCKAQRIAVRGEICLRRADAIPGSPARSQVNGWLHRTPEERSVGGAPALRFIAYQVIEPAGISRAEQFAWLAAAGFEVPWNKTVRAATEETLGTWLQTRRTDSPYDTDGIVIGTAGVPEPAAKDAANEAKDPSDAVAFKMPLAEQCAETTVRAIEWNAGKTGMLIPRISIEPVVIGSAQIAWVTGHNARFISDGGIGPGARVLIRRSGDVIPIVDSVLEAVEPALPLAGTWKWNSVHAEPLKQQDGTLIAQLLHSLKVLEVEGGGPAAAKAAFDAGVETIRDIIEWDEDDAVAVLGKTKGPQLIERTRAALEAADTFRRICACPCLGTGIGTRRIKAILDHYGGHIDAVCKEDRPPGWGEEMWEDFIDLTWPEVLAHLDDWADLVGEPAAAAGTPGGGEPLLAAAPKGDIVFTGVRDKGLEAKSVAAGWTPADTVKKTTKVLVIPDSEDPATYSTGKAAKARDYGVEIVRISTWRTRV